MDWLLYLATLIYIIGLFWVILGGRFYDPIQKLLLSIYFKVYWFQERVKDRLKKLKGS